jgi:ABC-2 type transport system permease protein
MTAPDRPGFWRLTTLVARREVVAQLRSRSFWISLGVLLAMMLLGILAGTFLGSTLGEPPAVAAVAATADQARAAGLTVVEVADDAEAEAAVRDGSVGAAVLQGRSGLVVVGLDQLPETVAEQLAVLPEVRTLEPVTTSEGVRVIVSIAFGLVFLFAGMTFGMTIAQNTVTEKQTRVVEILLSAVPTRALLAGKVVGNSILALGEITMLAAIAVAGMVATDRTAILDTIGAPIAWFVVFFLVGFLLLAALFAASASLVSRQEDLSSVIQPATWLVLAPYMLVVFFNSNPTVLLVMSYVPFSAPVAMPTRMFFGEAQWWEPLVSLALLAVSAAAVVVVAAGVYERSVLRMGARVRLKDVLRRASS